MFDRKVFFDAIRPAPFGGTLKRPQVDGMNFILDCWEAGPLAGGDLRHLAYPLATTLHETAATMQPIEEYQGASQPYGKEDPETHQAYFGRGFCAAHAPCELRPRR